MALEGKDLDEGVLAAIETVVPSEKVLDLSDTGEFAVGDMLAWIDGEPPISPGALGVLGANETQSVGDDSCELLPKDLSEEDQSVFFEADEFFEKGNFKETNLIFLKSHVTKLGDLYKNLKEKNVRFNKIESLYWNLCMAKLKEFVIILETEICFSIFLVSSEETNDLADLIAKDCHYLAITEDLFELKKRLNEISNPKGEINELADDVAARTKRALDYYGESTEVYEVDDE